MKKGVSEEVSGGYVLIRDGREVADTILTHLLPVLAVVIHA